jgi:hypothetical protein
MSPTSSSHARRAGAVANKQPKSLIRHDHRLQGILDLDDFERAVRDRLPRAIYGYVAHGSETETSLRSNRMAFDRWRLLTRVLVGVEERSKQTRLFGGGL